MKINVKKTEAAQKIKVVLGEFTNEEQIDILLQISIRLHVILCNNKKNFLTSVSQDYDLWEEFANNCGLI